MNTHDTQIENSCVSKLFQPCSFLLSYLNIGHQIHPSEPIGPKYSEFLVLSAKKTIRIIHIVPQLQDNLPRLIVNDNNVDKRASISRHSRHSLSEEYWFTRWNKPLKIVSCNCSFRRSQRYSKSEHLPPSVRQSKRSLYNGSVRMSDLTSKLSNYDVPAIKIVNVETFVERLIQDTFFEALQEYLMSKKVKESQNDDGVDNLAFSQSNDDVDGVVLRRKCYKSNSFIPLDEYIEPESNIEKRTDINQSLSEILSINANIPRGSLKAPCSHKTISIKNKPMVILLHGIGSTADIWWNIINKLSNKGHEIIAPDLLGHGYSSAPNNPGAYRFENLLKNVLQVFDHYVASDENRKAIIIGHSYGCSLATALARYRMQQIVQLILISGGGPTPLAAPTVSDELSVFNCLQTFLSPLLFCGLKRSFFYASRGKHFQPCEINNGMPLYVLKYIQNGQNWLEGDAAFHRRILIPTLLVHGLQDTNVTLVQECEMERTIPRAFLELIPNAGHMSMIETPEHLGHMILCFMEWWSR